MKGDDIADRLLDFSTETLTVIANLKQTSEAKHVARQLTRAGTSGGANYEEARGAESRADFAHKVSIAAKEVREAVYWLKLIQRSGLSKVPVSPWLIQEGNELIAILRASGKTARSRGRSAS